MKTLELFIPSSITVCVVNEENPRISNSDSNDESECLNEFRTFVSVILF